LGNRDGPILGGADEHILDDPNDLVALAPADDDPLSRFLRDNFGWCCRVSIVLTFFVGKPGMLPTRSLFLKHLMSLGTL
jgi:hypothetical protein